MMERSHLEDALPVRQLEINYLNNVRKGFYQEDEAERNQNQRHIKRKGHRCQRTSKEQRPGITHENLSRIEVIEQETE